MAPSILLVDIEGTTTSISFVKDILFPYVSKNLEEYLDDNWNLPTLNEDIELLRNDAFDQHKTGNLDIPLIPVLNETNNKQVKQAIIENIQYQMSIDRKSNSLKNLQGKIWQKAYEKQSLHGHVYEDVPRGFKRWTEKLGIKIYIYSSGSVEAQKLLFKHSTEGNLLTYISGHFDTNVGAKVESSSYTKILKELNTTPENVLFLTDVLKEAIAAKSAGIKCVIVKRPGNYHIEKHELDNFKTITTFDDLDAIIFEKKTI